MTYDEAVAALTSFRVSLNQWMHDQNRLNTDFEKASAQLSRNKIAHDKWVAKRAKRQSSKVQRDRPTSRWTGLTPRQKDQPVWYARAGETSPYGRVLERIERRILRREQRQKFHAKSLALHKRQKAYSYWLRTWRRYCEALSSSKSRQRTRITDYHFSYQPILGTHYSRPTERSGWTKVLDTQTPSANYPHDQEDTFDVLHPGPPYSVDGTFRNSKRHFPAQQILSPGDYYNYNRLKRYSGGFIINPSFLSTGWDELYTDVNRSYVSYGAQGWNKFRPNNPAVGLGVDLVEIAEIPMMFKNLAKSFNDTWKALKGKGSRKMISPSRLSAEFLGVNFGWIPFLSDVRDMVETTENLQSLMKQLRSKNGVWSHRGGTITSSVDTEVIAHSDTQTKHWPVLTGDYYQNIAQSGSYKVIKRTSRRIWFSANFRYYFLPSTLDDEGFDFNFKRHLYGLEISPTLLWQAMPWSWLVDWWSGFGYAFQNLDTNLADSLVSQHACVMGHESTVFSVESECRLYDKTLNDTLSYSVEHGARDIASPYGFGYTWQNLSVRRLGILSALGVTRLGHLVH